MVDIVLLHDVAKLGTKGSVVQTSSGYAQFLIRAKKAIIATSGARKNAEQISRAHAQEKTALAESLKAAIEKIDSRLTVSAKANEKGHLFEGIDAKKLAQIFADHTGISLPESALLLDAPIKETGEHPFTVILDNGKQELIAQVEGEK